MCLEYVEMYKILVSDTSILNLRRYCGIVNKTSALNGTQPRYQIVSRNNRRDFECEPKALQVRGKQCQQSHGVLAARTESLEALYYGTFQGTEQATARIPHHLGTITWCRDFDPRVPA